jgi:adenylate cyclase
MKKSAIILLLCLGWWPFSFLQAQWTNERATQFLDYGISKYPDFDIDSVFVFSDSLNNSIKADNNACLYARARSFNALLLITQGKKDEALAHCIEADKVLQVHDCPKSTRALLLSAFASIYTSSSLEKSIESATAALRLCQTGDCEPIQVVRLYTTMALNQKKSPEKKLAYLDSALTVARNANNNHWQMKVLVNISSAYARNGDFNNGMRYAMEAIKSARKLGAYLEMSVLYNNLAGMSTRNDTILAYVDSAIYYAKEAKSTSNQQAYTQNKALFYTMIGEWENGYKELWKALVLKDTLYKKKRIAVIAEMDEKYEAEKRNAEIQKLKVESLNTELEKIRYRRNQNRLVIGSIALVLVIGFLSYSVVSIRKNRNILAAKNKEISKERKRSEELLLNILPAEIAQELKQTGKAEAKHFDLVTILFTDIVEFTRIADQLSTEELIEELNICFKRFDGITQEYGLEKIKTIGDSYMAAGGIPVDRGNAVRSTVLAALDMQDFMIARSEQRKREDKIGFDMRIGIHTGPVVAGIVGVKKFQYDIWGDTVNTASRMENASEAARVNISRITYEQLKEDPAFEFEFRGFVDVKGKGSMEMYFVSRRKA